MFISHFLAENKIKVTESAVSTIDSSHAEPRGVVYNFQKVSWITRNYSNTKIVKMRN